VSFLYSLEKHIEEKNIVEKTDEIVKEKAHEKLELIEEELNNDGYNIGESASVFSELLNKPSDSMDKIPSSNILEKNPITLTQNVNSS
jgi:hypothetical protein